MEELDEILFRFFSEGYALGIKHGHNDREIASLSTSELTQRIRNKFEAILQEGVK